ncbi:MAG: PEP-CTERM sorting domain-containing protein [Gammaproteobacteria bacterium]|nr:PEP-CTERM sorting domain-containing protein [Gammaproteobacteria bacterium]
MRNLIKLAGVYLIALPAWAVPFTATIPDSIGPMYGSSGPVSYVIATVTSPGQSADGAAKLTFDVIGYGGIDGGFGYRRTDNDVSDNFTFRTGDTYFDIVLNMGGGARGPAPSLAAYRGVDLVSYADNGPGQGGLAQFSVDFTLLKGDNIFVFQYGCCSPFNGTEEGWGLRNVVITADLQGGPPATGVPEPMTLSLLLAGMFGIGTVLRRRVVL